MVTLPETLVDAYIAAALQHETDSGDSTFAEQAVDVLVTALRKFSAGLVVQPLTGVAFGSIVYYLRRSNGDIKIGYSAYASTRLTQIMREHGPIDVLAYEPGGAQLETVRHGQFDHCRITARGEWFRPGADLLLHIHLLNQSLQAAQLAALCGDCPGQCRTA
jgi:hypothetical protein